MSDDLDLKFGADTAGIAAGAREVMDHLDGIAAKSQEIQDIVKGLGEALIVAFAVDAIRDFVNEIVELGHDAERTAVQLGMTASEVAKLNDLADAGGVSHDEMRRAAVKLIGAMKDSKDETTEQAAAFRALGISQDQVAAGMKNLDGFLRTVGGRMSTFADGPNKTALAVTLLGKTGGDLIPVMNSMGDTAQHAGEQMKSMMDASMIDSITETRVGIAGMNSSFENTGLTIYSQFKPAIDSVVKGVTDLANGFTNSVREGGAMAHIMNVLEAAINAVVTSVYVIIQALGQTWDMGKMVFQDLATRAQMLADIIKAAFTGDWGDITAIHEKTISDLDRIHKQFANDTVEREKAMKKTLSDLWSHGTKGPAEGRTGDGAKTDKPDAPTMNKREKGGQDKEIQALMAKYDTMQQLAENNYEVVMQIEEKKLQLLKRMYGEDSKEYQNELRKKIQLEQRHQRESVRNWMSAFRQIGSSFKQSITGMIDGTMTWRDAMRNVFRGLLSGFMDMVEKMVMKWIEKEMLETAASTTGSAARAAAETTAASASGTAIFASIIKKIVGFAQQTFAGVFAFLSSFMGPAAVGPAAGAAATVSAVAAAVPSYDVGSWSIPQDQMAMVHAGEMVVPKNFADQMRSGGMMGGGDGGGALSLTIQAVDANSVARLFKNNAGALADALKHAHRNLKRGMKV